MSEISSLKDKNDNENVKQDTHVDRQKDHRHDLPLTATSEGGGPRRNIQRKNHAGKKSRSGSEHGQKGQKGSWSVTDDGSMQAATNPDPGDPSYDPEEDENQRYIFVSDSAEMDEFVTGEPLPGLSLPEFKAKLRTILEEYFVSAQLEEACESIRELDSPIYHYEVVKRAVNMSLDRNDRERELVSKLLSEAYPNILSSSQIGKGFQRLFEIVDDIQIDAPAARQMIAAFLARSVVDEILPPSFLRIPAIISLGGDIVENARRLLNRDHMLSRVERVWGPGDGRPVEELKVAIDQLLAEYLLAKQLDEAAQCVKDLNSPHFHHEVVKRAVKTAIADSSHVDEDCRAISSLFSYLARNEVIQEAQIKMGFERLYADLPDLSLDCPSAAATVDSFVQQAKKDGCLAEDTQFSNAQVVDW